MKAVSYETKLKFYYEWRASAPWNLSKIEILYNVFNKLYFKSELPQIPLVIASTFKGLTDEYEFEDSFGFFCYNKNKKGFEYIILSSEATEDIEDVLLHEMLHFYNYLHDIADYDNSKDGDKHSQKFIDQAKALGLPHTLWTPDENNGNSIINGVQFDENFLNEILSDEEVILELAETLQKVATTQ